MDYRKILKAYIEEVIKNESVTFISELEFDYESLSREEAAELIKIGKEVKAEIRAKNAQEPDENKRISINEQ